MYTSGLDVEPDLDRHVAKSLGKVNLMKDEDGGCEDDDC